MQFNNIRICLLSFLTLPALLTACGGGGDSSSSSPEPVVTPPANTPPSIVASQSKTLVNPEQTVTIDASGSSDKDGSISSYNWVQVSGPEVTLSGVDSDTVQFSAPNAEGAQLEIELTVTDDDGDTSSKTFTLSVNSAPQLVMSTPIADSRFYDEKIHIAGTVTDDGALEQTTVLVTVGSDEYDVEVSADGSWITEAPLALESGELQITAIATDSLGAQSVSQSVSLEYRSTYSDTKLIVDPLKNNIAYIIEQKGVTWQPLIFEHNLDTGYQKLLVDTTKLENVSISFPEHVIFDRANNRIIFSTGNDKLLTAFNLNDYTFSVFDIDRNLFSFPGAFALSNDGTRAYLLDIVDKTISELNLTTAESHIISGPAKGSGSAFRFAGYSNVFVNDDGQIFVYDDGNNAVFSVDVATGDRNVISGSLYGKGSGEALDYTLSSINLANEKLGGINQQNQLVEVDLISGDRTVLADLIDFGAVSYASDIQWSPSTQEYVVNLLSPYNSDLPPKMISVKSDGVATTLLSDTVGGGESLKTGYSLTTDIANNRLFTIAQQVTGPTQRSYIAEIDTNSHEIRAITAENEALSNVGGLVYNAENGLLYFFTYQERAIYSADPESGNITRIADIVTDKHGALLPRDMAVHPSGSALFLVTNDSYGPTYEEPTVLKLALETNQISIVTDNSTGLNSMLISPETIVSADDSLYIGDEGNGGTTSITLQKIDIATGDTTVFSDNNDSGEYYFNSAYDLWLDTTNEQLMLVHDSNISQFDIKTGERKLLSAANLYSGEQVGNGEGTFTRLTQASHKGYVYALDTNLKGLFLINTQTGDRFLVQRQ
ncbi:hypothetical protein HHX48_14320 [Salinimonas sp. HHU 13199]|uniref:PKD/Chitinase domain-containing protein n=1 Tax=Salinimonas profundi TaxID=2729140 RepID=A0ABR8LNG6_9ALTE|nr:SMP-30/gluconolactonase/LRE family protein [Salinimonas profundi]MBD3586918.1 hypothetical protein [Salinimonas profundi]